MNSVFWFSLLAVACLAFFAFHFLIVSFKEDALQKAKTEGRRVNDQLKNLLDNPSSLPLEERQKRLKEWYQSRIH